jgi:hypothetical protein
MLRVRELVNRLKDLPDQDAVVLIGEGTEPDVWLVVTGIVERRARLSEYDADCARLRFTSSHGTRPQPRMLHCVTSCVRPT